MHASGITGKVTVSTAKKIISAVRYKVADMEHLIFQVRGGHPQSDWYHKELIGTDAFRYYYPFIREFKDTCVTSRYDKVQFCHLNPYEKLFALIILIIS